MSIFCRPRDHCNIYTCVKSIRPSPVSLSHTHMCACAHMHTHCPCFVPSREWEQWNPAFCTQYMFHSSFSPFFFCCICSHAAHSIDICDIFWHYLSSVLKKYRKRLLGLHALYFKDCCCMASETNGGTSDQAHIWICFVFFLGGGRLALQNICPPQNGLQTSMSSSPCHYIWFTEFWQEVGLKKEETMYGILSSLEEVGIILQLMKTSNIE